jgi:Uma2 family endonuclease
MQAPEVELGPPPDTDERVILQGVRWQDYERLATIRGESSVPRMTYLRGMLELMSPGKRHEKDKTKLGRLVEAYADLLGIVLEGLGSWTVKREKEEAGAEADECYIVGAAPDEPEAPDLAIEVVHTSGGLSKLEVWHRLGAREVWFWLRDRLQVYVRRGDGWEAASQSELLPAFDLALIERCMAEPNQSAAVRALRAALAI